MFSKAGHCHAFSRFQFIPQIIFLNSLFGYLSLLIILKWCTGSQADLYHVMIYMFLSPTDELGENQLFPQQKTVQVDSIFCCFSLYLSCIRDAGVPLIHLVYSVFSLCYYYWPLFRYHGCYSQSLSF